MNNREKLGKGLLAGLAATIVLSGIMMMKQAMGLMPNLDPIAMITHMSGSSMQMMGWAGHFFIGTVLWGSLYALVNDKLPGPHWARGAIFATGAWLVMMIMLMPMAGAGLFGLGLGMMAPIATLMLHWVYGAVLGAVYGVATRREAAAA